MCSQRGDNFPFSNSIGRSKQSLNFGSLEQGVHQTAIGRGAGRDRLQSLSHKVHQELGDSVIAYVLFAKLLSNISCRRNYSYCSCPVVTKVQVQNEYVYNKHRIILAVDVFVLYLYCSHEIIIEV